MREWPKNIIFKWNKLSLVFVLMMICAGNITNSFMLKWGFRDESGLTSTPTYGLLDMMLGRSPKPFVYRSGLAQFIYHSVQEMPAKYVEYLYKSILKFDILHHVFFYRIPDADWNSIVAIVFHLMYLMIILFALALNYLVFKIARINNLTYLESIAVMVGFSFLYPLTFQQGGYYYDFPELVGAFSSMLAFLYGRFALSTCLMILFSFNKETFFLFPIFLYFLYPEERGVLKKLTWTTIQVVACFLVRHFIMNGYDGNSGGMVEYHLFDNIEFWINPASYFSFNQLIGKAIMTPSLENPLLMIPLITYFSLAWGNAPRHYRRFFLVSIFVLFPLFVLFGYRDEIRNFSLAFPSVLLMAICGVRELTTYFNNADSSLQI